MNLLKCLTFLSVFYMVTSMGYEDKKQQKYTTIQPSLERLLSRKKRFLLMPKGGNLKFTVQLSKRLLAAFPRGFNFVLEAALYYPTPGARIDLIPKRLRKPTTTTPKPKGTKPPIFVCIPGSLICYKAKPAIKPMKIQRIDENITSTQWIEPQKPYENHQNYQKYTQKYSNPEQWNQWNQWTKYGQPQPFRKYKWNQNKTETQPNYYQKWKPQPQSAWTRWTTEMPPYQQQRNWWTDKTRDYKNWIQPRINQYKVQQQQQRWRRTLTRTHNYIIHHEVENKDAEDPHESLYSYEPMYFPELEPHYDWHQYHSHRDRRQLFHQFEGLTQILGFDMKSCIVRAICESKRYLLPPGYSMIQDILRLVFTLPTIDGLTDEYSRAMNADFETCDKFLRPKCPVNILNWFINSEKSIQ